jgi:hypothetical protein
MHELFTTFPFSSSPPVLLSSPLCTGRGKEGIEDGGSPKPLFLNSSSSEFLAARRCNVSVVRAVCFRVVFKTKLPRVSGPVWHRLNAGVFRQLLKLALEAGIFAFGK